MSLLPGSPHPSYASSLAVTVSHHSHYCLVIELAPLPGSELPRSVNGSYSSQIPWRVAQTSVERPQGNACEMNEPISIRVSISWTQVLAGGLVLIPTSSPGISSHQASLCPNASGNVAFSAIGARRRRSREGGTSLPSLIYSETLF